MQKSFSRTRLMLMNYSNVQNCLWRGHDIRSNDNKKLPARQPLTNSTNLHICEEQFETITQCTHVRIRIALQFKALGNDFDIPALQRCILSCFEAQEEITGVLGVDTESVNGPFRICHGVSC